MACRYRSSPGPLSQLLSRLVQEGKVEEEPRGTFRFRPTRAGSPSAARAGSRSPQPAARALPPTPSGSRGRRPSSTPASSSSSSGGGAVRMADISAYEGVVLELLQNYAGLSLERLDTLLASSGARAPGYVSNPAALSGLLTALQSQGRVTKEQGVYRYRTSGRSPQAQRARSPSPLRGGPAPTATARAATPPSVPSSLPLRGASPTPSRSVGPAPLPEDDWGAYESTLMTLMGNYGALPLERLHEMLQMSMVWPRYDRTPAQLASYLGALAAAGKVVADNGLYRKAGTPPPARPGAGPTYASTPANLAAAEGHVLSTLAAYPGLTLERLRNMLRLSKDGPA